jgi:hypothetical protein
MMIMIIFIASQEDKIVHISTRICTGSHRRSDSTQRRKRGEGGISFWFFKILVTLISIFGKNPKDITKKKMYLYTALFI